MKFYLGTHHPSWLRRFDVPMFVSHRAFLNELPNGRSRPMPRARVGWALDSGAFTEVSRFGEFVTAPADYVAAVRRYRDEIGLLEWCSPQDHMTEPFVLARSRIASTVAGAQRWTVDNFAELTTLDADLGVIPVLQGQTLDDYWRHVDMYAAAGVELDRYDRVGLGSVCRRQSTDEVVDIVTALAGVGLALHGFGVKTLGLARIADKLVSADSMAWSYNGRRVRPCPENAERRSCNNCAHHALAWHRRLVGAA